MEHNNRTNYKKFSYKLIKSLQSYRYSDKFIILININNIIKWELYFIFNCIILHLRLNKFYFYI